MSKPLAVIPTERFEDWWQQRHQQKLLERQALGNKLDIVFIGDSITHAWEDEGKPAWQQYFGPQKSLNLGFAEDRTEHLLWRIQNGEIDELCPKMLVLLIGTNNAGHRLDSPEDIAAGIKVILDELKKRLLTTTIVLMAIFPRSRNTQKPMRKRVNLANQLIKQYADTKQAVWLDINQHFLTEDEVLLESVMPDLLHLNSAQYWVWAEQIKLLQQNMP
ncbi:GDSL-type esterase/lipase family protein [Paraglaciecola arctica]|uniref:1-alkyl-2-acetylglycerophosphocholine esterase n=1 Tax=Paraglaciecola arctica BSs20135 TaxID=493475 RepID=K6YBZ6_9ALTE|nr:GDSL-type esterase/lipase family protein [Paraglaciecola arctica]GAC21471.1 1-alkyl-2-acetylglycerophosphocholine esterase [Paraglaciecola arctica BSs20135]